MPAAQEPVCAWAGEAGEEGGKVHGSLHLKIRALIVSLVFSRQGTHEDVDDACVGAGAHLRSIPLPPRWRRLGATTNGWLVLRSKS